MMQNHYIWSENINFTPIQSWKQVVDISFRDRISYDQFFIGSKLILVHRIFSFIDAAVCNSDQSYAVGTLAWTTTNRTNSANTRLLF